ncbi:MAG: hypothetical protein HY327_01440 [Chloroflexi bacterium]|nr:hypothetical protein [Chloroflexota bacterium]
MIRTESKIAQLIEQAKQTDSPAEWRLDDNLVLVVLSGREYARWRGMRLLEKVIAKRPRKSPKQYLVESRRALRRYEKKYKMSSAEFYRRFQAAELEESMDFFDWRVEYNSYRRMKKKIANGKRQTA